jgi:DNA-binding CsgD family transcriptional regulator/tetratricopeptide (TPR) repeat protein
MIETKPEALIGRSSELARFPPFLDSLTVGAAALVLEGEPGIGKTSLWSAGVTAGRERGYQVLSYRAAEAEMQLPFVALGDLLGGLPGELLAPLPAPQRRALDVAMLRADAQGTAIERRAVSLAVVGVLQALAAAAPVVIALDDMQWIDASSSAALQFAVRRLADARVGLLGTQLGRRGAVALADVLPNERVERVEIAALGVDSLGRLVFERLGLPLARPALLQLYRVSAGNPFLALEIARALQRREVTLVPGQPFPVPQNLRELVRDRLEHLPADARETGVVVAALAQPTVERVETALAAAGARAAGLSEALAAGIVEIENGRVRFTHPLLGSIMYSETSATRRRELHAQLALAVDDVEERARHLALAATGPDPTVAAALDDAALQALRRGAPEAAADLYEQAARLTPPDERAPRYRRSIDAGEARKRAGDVPAARATFESAAEEAPDRGARTHALTRLGSMLLFDWQPEGLAASLATYERAKAEAGSESELMCAIELDLAWLYHFRGERIPSAGHARRAIELAEETGNRERLARALLAAAMMEGRGGNEEARGLLERAFSLEDHVRNHPFADRPQFVHALFLAGDGRLDEARAILGAEYRRALDAGDEGSLPTVLEHITLFEGRAGNWDDAERYARDMYEKTERGRSAPHYHSRSYAWILALRGRVDEARVAAHQGLELADAAGIGPVFGGHRAVLGFIALSTGDARGCADILEPTSALLTPEIPENGWFRFLADDVEAQLALGEIEQAGTLVERLAERRGVLLDSAWARTATERCRALVLAAEGDEEGAFEAFDGAHREHEHMQEPFELARTLLAHGRAARRFKRRRKSREHLTVARSLFARLGSPRWVDRADEELRRIGGRPTRAPGLTATEERVAQLAAIGRTNREIAATLFLSVNTVQAYLKRIYRELGIRSRTELANTFTPGEASKDTDSGVSGRSPSS